MTVLSNTIGLIPDVIGGHGIAATLKDLPDLYKLKQDGGILSRHGVVEYVNGIASGVFAAAAESDAKGYVPFGLVTKKSRMLKDAKKDQLLTLDMVELDQTTLIYKLRKEQDAMYNK